MAAFGKKARAALLVAALLTLVMLGSIAAAQIPRRAPEQRLDQRLTVEELGKAHSSLRQTRDSDTIDIILALHEGANLSAGRPGRSKGLRYANLSGLELASLLTDTAVQWVWPDLQTQAWLDRSVYQIGADALWAFNLTGAGVKIAILDTGIAAEHEMLSGRVVATADFTGSYGYDGHGHGTHVAGIAAGDGQYTGVAPGAQIYSGKVLNDQG
ncbi:S8 family serine peptidase, partial [Candidatus Woesearchaeota archaeon]|nr:S8 family serine peptidase [Candidatus Woesearchaeota archaeon]